MGETNRNKKIIAVLDDLLFSSKMREAAKSLGADLEIIKNADGLVEKIKSENPSLIIFDLNSKRSNPLDAVKTIKTSPEIKSVSVLGYLSHVQTELKEEAIKAGCDVVLPRSKFSMNLREILTKHSTHQYD